MNRLGVLIIMMLAGLLSACSEDPAGPDEELEPRSFAMGSAGLIPRNWPAPASGDWNNLFDEVIPSYGELLGVHTGWNEGNLDEEGIPVVINTAFARSEDFDVRPYVAIGVEPDHLTQQQALTYFLDHGEEFVNVCVAVAEKHQPDIMLIGVEINRFYEKSPEGFEHFLDVYTEAYNAIKDVSPGTMVGSNFQYEYLIGEARRSNMPREPHWEIVDGFLPRMDLVSFSVYPFLDYDRPGDIPGSYLQPIISHTARPLMITETGWPSEPNPNAPDIEASQELQTQYLEKLLEMIDPLPFDWLVWSFQHDIKNGPANGLFDYISLRENDGAPKAAYERWIELVERPLQ